MSYVDIKEYLDMLTEHYTGPEFGDLCKIDQGFHLIRAIDEAIYDGLFYPVKPEVTFQTIGYDEIVININSYSRVPHVITLKAIKCQPTLSTEHTNLN